VLQEKIESEMKRYVLDGKYGRTSLAEYSLEDNAILDNSRYPKLAKYGCVHGQRGRNRPMKGRWKWYKKTAKL